MTDYLRDAGTSAMPLLSCRAARAMNCRVAVPGSSLHSIRQPLCQAPATAACTCTNALPSAALPLQCTAALPKKSHAMCLQGPRMSMKEQIAKFSKIIYVGGELRVHV